MKKITALILCFSFLFLAACSNKDDNIKYVNGDQVSKVGQEVIGGWEDFKTVTQGSIDTTLPVSDISELLPENFPEIPEGISDLTMVKRPYTEGSDYPTEYTEINFICEYITLVNFSQSLKELGYKGGIKEIENGTYYPSGIHGAWQDGKYLIRIAGSEALVDGSHAITINIVPCKNMLPAEIANITAPFNGFSGALPFYYEYVNGEPVKREFDGSFHAKWKIVFSSLGSFAGVTLEDIEKYCADLEAKGYTIGTVETGTLDGCNVFLGDAASNDESIYILYVYNESLSTMDLYITNDVDSIINELYGE